MNILLAALIIAVILSFPISLAAEKKYGFGKRAALFHLLASAVGALEIVGVCLIFHRMTGAADSGVKSWAEDFFFGYLKMSLPAVILLCAVLAVSAAVDHQMRRTRTALFMLVPAAAVILTLISARLAVGGQFPADRYIRWLAPGIALLVHSAHAFTKRT